MPVVAASVIGTADRIRAAAIDLFRERGYSATSTRDIAARASITVGSLYNHFDSKQALLYDVALAAHKEALDVLEQATRDHLAPDATLRAAAYGHALFHAEHPAAIAVVYQDMTFLTPEQYRAIVNLRRQFESSFVRIISDGVEAGVFEVTDPALATIAILSMGIRVGAWYRPTGRLSPREIAAQYAEYALRLVGFKGESSL